MIIRPFSSWYKNKPDCCDDVLSTMTVIMGDEEDDIVIF